MNMLLQTDLVQESSNPEIYFELKPNLDTWFQAKRLRTNSRGLADKEYALEKPDNTFRVAVIGSSWTMPTGVLLEQAFHTVLEDELNNESDKLNFEFINFAVEYYGLREQIATARDKAMAWQPDMIIFGITTFTAALRWTDVTENEPLPDTTYPIFSSYSLRELDRLLKTDYFKRSFTSRPGLKRRDRGVMHAQLERAVGELDAMTESEGIPVVIMWLSNTHPGKETVAHMNELCESNNMLFVDAYKVLSSSNDGDGQKGISRFDKHPNGVGHRLIAEYLKQQMLDRNLLPSI
ncbi:MAG: hypothetical protein ACR2QG_02230 [Gammaproteobacteria bacterium]